MPVDEIIIFYHAVTETLFQKQHIAGPPQNRRQVASTTAAPPLEKGGLHALSQADLLTINLLVSDPLK